MYNYDKCKYGGISNFSKITNCKCGNYTPFIKDGPCRICYTK